jgi:hypothetical protein
LAQGARSFHCPHTGLKSPPPPKLNPKSPNPPHLAHRSELSRPPLHHACTARLPRLVRIRSRRRHPVLPTPYAFELSPPLDVLYSAAGGATGPASTTFPDSRALAHRPASTTRSSSLRPVAPLASGGQLIVPKLPLSVSTPAATCGDFHLRPIQRSALALSPFPRSQCVCVAVWRPPIS